MSTITSEEQAQDAAAERRRAAALVAAAGGLLMLGLLVYLTDRSSAALIPRFDALAGRHLFGAVGQWLPSFVHPLAFSLLTAAALPATAAPRYGVCLVWGLVNVSFEAGQHAALAPSLADALYDTLGRSTPVRRLADYFVHGTYDVGDLLAAILGAMVAAAVLTIGRPRREYKHAQ